MKTPEIEKKEKRKKSGGFSILKSAKLVEFTLNFPIFLL